VSAQIAVWLYRYIATMTDLTNDVNCNVDVFLYLTIRS